MAEVPAQQWADWLKAEYAKRMSAWSDIRDQMPLLYDAARTRERPEIAELGTRTGQSTSALLAGAARSGGHVWSVDPGPVTVPDWWHETGLWSFLAAGDMSEEAAAWVPAELDILFIDTSHTYEHTLAELRRYVPRVRPGGTVLCHDPELRHDDFVMGEAWVGLNISGPEYPVAAALDDYCAEAGLTWTRQEPPPAPDPGAEQGPVPGWDQQVAARLGGAGGQPFYGLGYIVIPVKPARKTRARA